MNFSQTNCRRGEIAVGIGVFESAIQIENFKNWAWVGLLIRNPTDARILIKKESIRVVVEPPLLETTVFLYGPYDERRAARVWGGADARKMREDLLRLGNPLPDQTPLRELVLSKSERAVLWIYLEDRYVDLVSVVVVIGATSVDRHEVRAT